MNRKGLKSLAAALARKGIEVVSVMPRGSGHFRMTVRRGSSRSFVTVSSSPSDRRGLLNTVSDAKRALDEAV